MKKLTMHNASQISPCILAKIRYALGISKQKPKNNKTCSKEYWDEVVEIIGGKNNNILNEINKAKQLFEFFAK